MFLKCIKMFVKNNHIQKLRKTSCSPFDCKLHLRESIYMIRSLHKGSLLLLVIELIVTVGFYLVCLAFSSCFQSSLLSLLAIASYIMGRNESGITILFMHVCLLIYLNKQAEYNNKRTGSSDWFNAQMQLRMQHTVVKSHNINLSRYSMFEG